MLLYCKSNGSSDQTSEWKVLGPENIKSTTSLYYKTKHWELINGVNPLGKIQGHCQAVVNTEQDLLDI